MGVKASYSYNGRKLNILSQQQCIMHYTKVKAFISNNNIDDIVDSEYFCKKKLFKQISPYNHNTAHYASTLDDTKIAFLNFKIFCIVNIIDILLDNSNA